MYNIFKDLLNYMPDYLNELFRLVIGPKKHIQHTIATDPNTAWKNSLRFAFICFIIIFLLKWLALSNVRDIQQIVVGEGLLAILEFAVSGLLLLLVWKLFGVKHRAQETMTVFAFILGISILIQGIFQLTQLGSVKMLDPELYAVLNGMNEISNIQELETLSETYSQEILQPEDAQMRQATLKLLNIITIIASVLALIWMLLAWPVYGTLYSVGRFKVYVTLAIFLVIDEFNPVSFLKVFVMMAWS